MWSFEVDFIYQLIYPLLCILKIPAEIPSAGHIASLHSCLLAIVISFFLFLIIHLLVLPEFCSCYINRGCYKCLYAWWILWIVSCGHQQEHSMDWHVGEGVGGTGLAWVLGRDTVPGYGIRWYLICRSPAPVCSCQCYEVGGHTCCCTADFTCTNTGFLKSTLAL